MSDQPKSPRVTPTRGAPNIPNRRILPSSIRRTNVILLACLHQDVSPVWATRLWISRRWGKIEKAPFKMRYIRPSSKSNRNRRTHNERVQLLGGLFVLRSYSQVCLRERSRRTE